VKIIQLSLFG